MYTWPSLAVAPPPRFMYYELKVTEGFHAEVDNHLLVQLKTTQFKGRRAVEAAG